MTEDKERFEYTYSAAQQEELKKIKEKYSAKNQEEDKMEQIRRLDNSVTKPGTIASLAAGITGCLIFGTGMSMVMEFENLMAPGIVVGILGILVMAAAYPVYRQITNKRKEKMSAQINSLIDELMK